MFCLSEYSVSSRKGRKYVLARMPNDVLIFIWCFILAIPFLTQEMRLWGDGEPGKWKWKEIWWKWYFYSKIMRLDYCVHGTNKNELHLLAERKIGQRPSKQCVRRHEIFISCFFPLFYPPHYAFTWKRVPSISCLLYSVWRRVCTLHFRINWKATTKIF